MGVFLVCCKLNLNKIITCVLGSPVTIRIATKSDVVDIRRLVGSLTHFYLTDKDLIIPDWFEKTITEQQFLKRIESPDYSNYVYEINDQIVGYIAMKGTNHLYHLFISEDQQGNGFSKVLWEHASNECASDTYTLRSSIYAIPVCKAFGFTESGSIKEKDGIGFQAMELCM